MAFTASFVGETERPVIDHFEEARRAAAVLDIRLALGVRGAKVKHIQIDEDVRQVRLTLA